MTKKFRFDDDEEIEVSDQESSHVDEFENMKQEEFVEFPQENIPPKENESFQVEDDSFGEMNYFEDLDEEPMKQKKKKKLRWRWWYGILIVIGIIVIALVSYILVISLHEGPVYGNRCEGMVTISKDILNSAIDEIKAEHSDIEDITFEIACRQLKVDITYVDGMDAQEAEEIAEKAVQTLDHLAGYPIEDGKTYSNLFGKIDNVSQYEVNVILFSNDSEDFPIYGTKHIQKDSFSYTLASIKDQESYDKAQATLEEDE